MLKYRLGYKLTSLDVTDVGLELVCSDIDVDKNSSF